MSSSLPLVITMSEELRSLFSTAASTTKFLIANDKYAIGKKALQQELLTKSELQAFEKRIKECETDGDFPLDINDILLFYTCLELSIKCFLSEAGEEFKQLSIKHGSSTPEQFDTVKKFYMLLAGRFIEGMRNDFKGNAAFQAHLKKLEAAAI